MKIWVEYCEYIEELSLLIISNLINTNKYILNSLYTGNHAQDLITIYMRTVAFVKQIYVYQMFKQQVKLLNHTLID